MHSPLLERIPAPAFEAAGLAMVAVGLVAITAQLRHEWIVPGPSGLSLLHTGGFLATFLFWVVYGLRFRRPAVWAGNGAAVLLQATLLITVIAKG